MELANSSIIYFSFYRDYYVAKKGEWKEQSSPETEVVDVPPAFFYFTFSICEIINMTSSSVFKKYRVSNNLVSFCIIPIVRSGVAC